MYQKIHNKLLEKGCTFRWTESDFNESYKTSKSIIPIVSKCGHDTEVQCSNFMHKNTGILCKKCTLINVSKSVKGISKDYILQEYNVVKALQILTCAKFRFEIMTEGCLVDFAIKPNHIEDDLWLPIQLKTTLKHSHGLYSFSINKKYKDMIVILFAIEDQKIWIFNGNDIDVIKKINIGVKSSIYSKNEVNFIHLCEYLERLYDLHRNFHLELAFLNIPISESAQKASDMNRFVETTFSMLNFKYPEIGGTIYDRIINNTYKIQDKVATCYFKKKQNNSEYREMPCYMVNLSRNSNISCKYKKGDNDFYWIHLPDKKGAYIFPENVLIEKGIVGCADKIRHLNLFPYHTRNQMIKNKVKNVWVNDYLYFYDSTNDKEKIQKLFEPNGREAYTLEYVCPIEIKV